MQCISSSLFILYSCIITSSVIIYRRAARRARVQRCADRDGELAPPTQQVRSSGGAHRHRVVVRRNQYHALRQIAIHLQARTDGLLYWCVKQQQLLLLLLFAHCVYIIQENIYREVI